MGVAARMHEATGAVSDRRTAVLNTAMLTFARYGYGRTSMGQVAEDAGISRQGLYFLFESKSDLFREAVESTLRADLGAARRCLANTSVPLRERLLEAFDHWAGRYLGPLTREVSTVIEDNPALVGPWVRSAPDEFAELIVRALEQGLGRPAARRVAPVLISASIGIKHQVEDRAEYLDRLSDAVDVLLAPASANGPSQPGP